MWSRLSYEVRALDTVAQRACGRLHDGLSALAGNARALPFWVVETCTVLFHLWVTEGIGLLMGISTDAGKWLWGHSCRVERLSLWVFLLSCCLQGVSEARIRIAPGRRRNPPRRLRRFMHLTACPPSPWTSRQRERPGRPQTHHVSFCRRSWGLLNPSPVLPSRCRR